MSRLDDLERVRIAARRLALKLKQIGDDRDFVAVFQIAEIHQGEYCGPDWIEELWELNKALDDVKSREQKNVR